MIELLEKKKLPANLISSFKAKPKILSSSQLENWLPYGVARCWLKISSSNIKILQTIVSHIYLYYHIILIVGIPNNKTHEWLFSSISLSIHTYLHWSYDDKGSKVIKWFLAWVDALHFIA